MKSSSDGSGVWPAFIGAKSRGGAGRLRAAICVLGIGVAVIAAGCGAGDKAATGPGTGGNPGPGPSDTVLSRVSGDSQTAPMGSRLANPLVVRVVDAKGNPLPDVTVSWAVSAGSGSIPATSVTNASGQASAHWTLDNTYMGDSAVALVAGHWVAFAAFGNGSGDLGGRNSFPPTMRGTPISPRSRLIPTPRPTSRAAGHSSPLHPDFGTVYAGAPEWDSICRGARHAATSPGQLHVRQ